MNEIFPPQPQPPSHASQRLHTTMGGVISEEIISSRVPKAKKAKSNVLSSKRVTLSLWGLRGGERMKLEKKETQGKEGSRRESEEEGKGRLAR